MDNKTKKWYDECKCKQGGIGGNAMRRLSRPCRKNSCRRPPCCFKTLLDDNHEAETGWAESVLVVDTITGRRYIYDADGIPTEISGLASQDEQKETLANLAKQAEELQKQIETNQDSLQKQLEANKASVDASIASLDSQLKATTALVKTAQASATSSLNIANAANKAVVKANETIAEQAEQVNNISKQVSELVGRVETLEKITAALTANGNWNPGAEEPEA